MSDVNADIVFVGGSVITVDERFTVAEALAVRDGRVAAVGDTAQIRELAGPDTAVVDLAGGAVLPGINDSHLHASMFGAYAPALWLDAMVAGSFPQPRTLDTDGARRGALRRCWDELLPLGITSYTEPGLGAGTRTQHGGSCDDHVLDVYAELAAAGELPLRVTTLALFGELDGRSDLESFRTGLAGLDRFPTVDPAAPHRWRLAGVKLFADGIPPMRTAWMHEPYEGDQGRGALLVDGDGCADRLAGLREMIRLGHRAGMQVAVHVTGDLGITETAKAMADAIDDSSWHDPRHYLIHADCTPRELMPTLARYGIGINAQPGIYTTTCGMLDAAIGIERTDAAAGLNSAVRAGVPLCLSSDGPVSTVDWRAGVVAAVHRRCQPGGTVRAPDERIALREALRAYTIAGAWQDRAEAWKGSLEPGKVADLCVLGNDPLARDADALPDNPVLLTLIDGVAAHDPDGRLAGTAHKEDNR